MPANEQRPGSGSQDVSASQVLLRRNLVVKGTITTFTAAGNATDFRTQTTLDVRNLPRIWVHMFLYPTYNDGVTTFNARNDLSWRPVFNMPPDSAVSVTNVFTTPWVPIVSPMLLTIGVPISIELCCEGMDQIAVEIRAPTAGDPATQGKERVLVSISASG